MDGLPRIGLIGQGWSPDVGGVESVLEHLAATLRARGHAVHVLALDRGASRAAWSPRDAVVRGVHVRRLALPTGERTSFVDDGDVPEARLAVTRWVRAFGIEAVEVHHLSGFGTGVLRTLDELDVPTAVTLHDPWTVCPRGQMWHVDDRACGAVEPSACAYCAAATWPALAADAGALRARLASARADLVRADVRFAPSGALARTLEAAGIDDVGVRTPSVDARRLGARVARLRAGRPPGRRLGVLGSVQPSKGVLELAHAVLEADVPGLTLEVHGPRHDYHGDRRTARALEALAAEHPRLRLHGPYALHERASVLATLDAVAVPSLWDESYGLSAREARAAGLPVLATRVGGLVELEGDPGVRLLEPGDVRAWTRALAELRFGSNLAAGPADVAAPEPLDWLSGARLRRAARASAAAVR